MKAWEDEVRMWRSERQPNAVVVELELPAAVVLAVEEEARRQGVSESYVVRLAWEIARGELCDR